MKRLMYCCVLLLCTAAAHAHRNTGLDACHSRVVPPAGQYLNLDYTETSNQLLHSFEPWQQTTYQGGGTLWCGAARLVQTDSIKSPWGKVYHSQTDWTPDALLLLDHGDKELSAITKEKLAAFVYQSARYNPALLVHYFATQKAKAVNDKNSTKDIYRLQVNGIATELQVNRQDHLPAQVSTLEYDALYGDIRTTYTYSDYRQAGQVYYPAAVHIEKINGKVKDEVEVTNATMTAAVPTLLQRPADYKIAAAAPPPPAEEATVYRHSDGLYFVKLKQADEQVMLVEFADYWLVADAPLNSANGELILAEAQKLAPGKPVKYFVFSHYHPHYNGGMRPFVHRGATVITTAADIPYLTYLATAAHSLQPDSLQLQPRPLLTDTIGQSKTITDGDQVLELYYLGERSAHTKDYVVYYFPRKKLLVQGDLVWIPKDGPVRKAGKGQRGVYEAIKEWGLDVDTIMQSWGTDSYQLKAPVTLADLEAAVKAE